MPISEVFLFRRRNGIWYIVYCLDGKRKWKSTGVTHKRDAQKILQEFDPENKAPIRKRKLSGFTEEFLSFADATYAHSTCNIYRVSLRYLREITGDCSLSDVSQRHVDFFKAKRIKYSSPGSVNDELRSLRTIFNYAVRWKLIANNPFTNFQQLPVPEMPPIYFTKEEFRVFLSAIKEEWFKEIIIFTVLTGMRRGEVSNLHWSDIDLEKKLVHIHSTPTFRSKWGKQRIIPLNDQLVEALKGRKSEDANSYVFTLQGQRVKEGYLSHRFRDYIKEWGIQKKLHFHSLRHTHATWLVQNKVSIYEVQKLLGHSSIEMTQKYSHLVSSELHDAVNKISINMQ